MPVEHAVIDGERHIRHRLDHHRVSAIDAAHDDALFELADAEDRRLRLVDNDRRRNERAGDAVIGDRERAALHVGGLQRVLARALGDVGERCGGLF